MRLPDPLADDILVFDTDGATLHIDPPPDAPATLLVVPVTDALKIVSGDRVAGSFDRGRAWTVVGFALRREVVERLGGKEMAPQALIEKVKDLGHVWQTRVSGAP